MKILALMVTGDINPKGSNIADDSRRTSHFVTKLLWLDKESWSQGEGVS